MSKSRRGIITEDQLTPYGRERLRLIRLRKQEEAYAAGLDTSKARVFLHGEVRTYDSDSMAYSVWLALPRGTRAAFRGIGDALPVYPHDFVDRL